MDLDDYSKNDLYQALRKIYKLARDEPHDALADICEICEVDLTMSLEDLEG